MDFINSSLVFYGIALNSKSTTANKSEILETVDYINRTVIPENEFNTIIKELINDELIVEEESCFRLIEKGESLLLKSESEAKTTSLMDNCISISNNLKNYVK